MTKFAIKNPVTVLVLALVLLIAGVYCWFSIPRESTPEVKVPYIYVSTIYAGASPDNIEKLITEKIEDKLEGVNGIKRLTSQSQDGISTIQVEFTTDVAVEVALQRVRDKVDAAKGDLPADAKDPVVQELDFSNQPIIVMALTGNYDISRLEDLAEGLRTKLQTVSGVLDAKVAGKTDREIAIDVDPARLSGYGLSLSDISSAVSAQHRNIPGGNLRASGNRFTIKLTGELGGPDEFQDIVVRSESGKTVKLRDIASVRYGHVRDPSSIVRLNGKTAISVQVTKRTGENILKITDDIKKIVEEESKTWPAGTSLDYTTDQSIGIRSMVSELMDHIILGVLLVVGVLTFFLGFRNSLFISTAIPFSMMLGFIVLKAAGITLNMVVLFSLVVSLGMLVDDGIVVVENIYRHLAMGKSRRQAALDGTREVMIPVTTATLTTIAAFFPLLWMPGILGQFFKYLPITIIVTLSGSLFVAFVFNPVFSSLFMHSNPDHHDEEGGGLFLRFKAFYGKVLEYLLEHPAKMMGGCLLFVVLAFVAYGKFGKGASFFPVSEPEQVSVEAEGPLGLDIHTTDTALAILEKACLAIPKDSADVATVATTVGYGKADNSMSGRQPERHKGYVDVNVKNFDDRQVPTWTTYAWMEKHLTKALPGWTVKVKKLARGPSTGKAIEYEISGEDFDVLGGLADSLIRQMRQMNELTNVGTDYNPAQPQFDIQVDREQAKRFGVGASEVAMAVRNSMYGIEAGKYRVGKDEWDIMVRLDTATRENFRAMEEITIPGKDGIRIPLLSVAKVKQNASLAVINRIGRRRTVQVWADLAPGQKDEQAPQKKVESVVKKLTVPAGYSIGPGSGRKDQAETTSFLGVVFVVAMALVFFTMVVQFNSIFQPLLILLGVVLALGGVFWGLLIVQVQMSIMMTGIGIIALAGIVAKNGIVLIDYMNHLKAEGLTLREVALDGGKTRLRPVLLTAVTAMIALVPMATGKGIDFMHLGIMTKTSSAAMWAPLAWAIFWGLLFNTMLVLIVTPVLYYNYYTFVARLKVWYRARKGIAAPSEH